MTLATHSRSVHDLLDGHEGAFTQAGSAIDVTRETSATSFAGSLVARS